MALRERGYTLVELLVVIAVFAVVTGVISVSFSRIVASSGQVTKSAETEIGGLIGLELFRLDLGLAGFGLPWSIPSAVSYDEAAPGVLVKGCSDGCTGADAALYNDAPKAAPRAIVLGDNVGFNGSDYLVLKGTPLGMSSTCRSWSYLNYSAGTTIAKPSKSDVELALGKHDRVIVVRTGVAGGLPARELVSDGSTFSVTFDDPLPGAFCPGSKEDGYLVYGIAPQKTYKPNPDLPSVPAPLAYPFNRSDYYLSRPSDISANCAPATAVLYKTTINQNDTTTVDSQNTVTYYPILDCVADMQVMFLLDTNGDGEVDLHTSDLKGYTPEAIREQVREIRVYILAQQGKKDTGYRYPGSRIVVGDQKFPLSASVWDETRLASRFGSDWMHYHWKLYTIAVQPKNLN